MIFVTEYIPSKLLTKHNSPIDVEGLFVELNFRQSKWLLFGTFHSPAQNDQYFFNCLDKALDTSVTIMFYLQETLMQKMTSLA